MARGQQLRLLLWKDYLMRKRNLVTLGGVVWAAVVMFSLVIVRSNVQTTDEPTCQYPARALPSAGMLPFLQSFICTINNECRPMDQFQEIPSYNNSRLHALQQKFSPVWSNDSILELARVLPDAARVLATLARVLDDSQIHEIAQNGLKVSDVFVDPGKAGRILKRSLHIDDQTMEQLMRAEFNLAGVFTLSFNSSLCDSRTVGKVLLLDPTSLDAVSKQACELSGPELQKLAIQLMPQINYRKYLNMLGGITRKLNGEEWFSAIGDMLSAVFRLTHLENFIPKEFQIEKLLNLFMKTTKDFETSDFTYFDISFASRFIDLFEPTFGKTDVFKRIQSATNSISSSLQWLQQVMQRNNTESDDSQYELINSALDLLETQVVNSGDTLPINEEAVKQGFEDFKKKTVKFFKSVRQVIDNSRNRHEENPLHFLSDIVDGLLELVPSSDRHQVLYYGTLLGKLSSGARAAVQINTRLEKVMFNVTARHPDAVSLLTSLQPNIIGKGFDALMNPERTQVLTSKIYHPEQMFCDVRQIQTFFAVSKNEADNLKAKLCNDAWNSYVKDVLTEFGIYNVRDRINDMASLIVSEFLGRSNDESLYTISTILSEFSSLAMESARAIRGQKSSRLDWDAVLKVDNDSALYRVARAKLASTNRIFISVHGALAHEVVHQNAVLESRLSGPLARVSSALSALVRLLQSQHPAFVQQLTLHRRHLLRTVLHTLADEEKLFRMMAADTTELFCNQSSVVEHYLVLPQTVDIANFTHLLCDISREFDNTLNGSSDLAKTLATLSREEDDLGEVKWNVLITAVQKTDALLQDRFGGKGEEGGDNIQQLIARVKQVWLEDVNLGRIVHLSVNVLLRVMDILDNKLFNMSEISPAWSKIKHQVDASNSLLTVADNVVNVITAFTSNSSTEDLQLPITASALKDLYTNLPALLKDLADILVSDTTDMNPLLRLMREDPAWPCSERSLGPALSMSVPSSRATRGLELMLCYGADLREEWTRHGHIANIQTIAKDSNKTIHSPHIFLTLSSRFNHLLSDLALLQRTTSNHTTPASRNNMAENLVDSWNYLLSIIRENNEDYSLYREVLSKADIVIDAWRTESSPSFDASLPLARLWEDFTNCTSDCTQLRLLASKYSIKFAATAGVQMIADLLEYFTEVNEPDVNALQIIGFTKKTGPYILWNKLPDFLLVLLNSYNDPGFMDQVRKSSNTAFWDCEALVDALVPPLGSRVTPADVSRVRPYLCPSLFYWLSVPTDENVLLDLFAKSQIYLLNTPVENLTGKLSTLLDEGLQLNDVLLEVSKKKSRTHVHTDGFLDTFENVIEENDALFWNVTGNHIYFRYNEMIKKQTASLLYQTQVTHYLYAIVESINKLNGTRMTAEDFKTNQNLKNFMKMTKRRPTELLEIFYNAITRKIMKADEKYDVANALYDICMDNTNNKTGEKVLQLDKKIVKQLCAIDYSWLLGMVFENKSADVPEKAFRNLVHAFGYNATDNTDFDAFWTNGSRVRDLIVLSLTSANSLGLRVYLQQLHSSVQHAQVSLRVLRGVPWWSDLRNLYPGPHATSFLDTIEDSFEIVEDVVQHLDKVKLVRLLKDVNVNDSSLFCEGVSLSGYLPDATGRLQQLQQRTCRAADADERELLYLEIPPLNFAAQGFSRKISTHVDETMLNQTMEEVSRGLEYLLQHPPSAPQLPSWITERRLATLQTTLHGLTTARALTNVAFALTYNAVDAVTLFGNSSAVCLACSTFTGWMRQINLQLIKWQDYTALVCRLDTLRLEQIYTRLKEDFHWDMAIHEIISRRNYTKIELNKSLNMFIDNVRLHLGHSALCLHNSTADDSLTRATFYVSLTTKILHLVRAAVPHLRSIHGAEQNVFLSDLKRSMESQIPVLIPVADVLNPGTDLSSSFLHNGTFSLPNLTNFEIDVNKIASKTSGRIQPHLLRRYIYLQKTSANWTMLCENMNCSEFVNQIKDNVNTTWIDENIERLRADAYWQFSWFSALLDGSRRFLSAAERLLIVATQLNVPVSNHVHVLPAPPGVPAVNLGMPERRQKTSGNLESWLDVLLRLVQKDTIGEVVESLSVMLDELHPLLVDGRLEGDLKSLPNGLSAIRSLMDDLVENLHLKWNIADIFKDFDDIESEMRNIGIIRTEFWTGAAKMIEGGTIDVRPLFSSGSGDKFTLIREYVCDPQTMSLVIFPALSASKDNDDDEQIEKVLQATSEQFCGLGQEQVKKLMPILMKNINMTFILQEVGEAILSRVYASSSLSVSRGTAALASASRGVRLLPAARRVLDDVTAQLKREPLFAALRNAHTIGELLSSPSFLSDAGRMLCGAPLSTDNNRFYKAIAETHDNVIAPDHKQLQALPSEFCRKLYVDILSMSGGKIVWSFAKPLLMGRVLFTPDNSETRHIMAHANASFASMSSMRSLVYGLSDALHSARDASRHRQGADTLQRLAGSQMLKNWLHNNGDEDDLVQTDIDLSQLFDSLPDAKVSELISKLSSLLECINLDRFVGVGSEEELERLAAQYTMLDEFSAGIVFLNMSTDAGSSSKSQVHYKIRMDIDSVPTTSRKRNQFWTPGPEGNFLEDMRYFRGFIQMQDLIDKAIISVSSHGEKRHTRAADVVTDSSDKHTRGVENEWAIYTQQMPYPCYKRDAFQATLYESQALIVAFFFCLILTVSSAVRFIVSEDESGNTALMAVMGMKLRNRTASWLIASSCEMLVTITIVFLVLKLGGVLPYSDPFLLWLLMLNFGFSVVMFCYLVSKLFRSGSLGAVCAVLLYLISFQPYVIILSMEAVLSTTQKIFTGMSMSTAFCYSVLYVARLEVQGEGLQWSTLWNSPGYNDDMNVAITAIIVLADAVLYAAVGYVIELFNEYHIGNGKFIKNSMRVDRESETDADADVGVSVCNVSKVYRGGRRALDDVSVELLRGQITALLGHNGAGKTTLIKILTGMLKPTSGKVVIGGLQDSKTCGGRRARLGVCPQSDVLVECMSAAEHLSFYAQLKTGLSADAVADHVNDMLSALSLGALSQEPAHTLSGGLRRRLCVSLAFVARPDLVVLDEPSSGVDPLARRDIWSLIVRLKEGRTVLLTTHHLDEAELLSDRVIIMDKGRVFTSGSPLALKHNFGDGYTLTVTYELPRSQLLQSTFISNDEKRNHWTIGGGGNDWSEDSALIDPNNQEWHERIRDLLETVQSVTSNARLRTYNGEVAEVVIPFHDSTGNDNDLLSLSKVLERRAGRLHYQHFALDCCSLERVFWQTSEQSVPRRDRHTETFRVEDVSSTASSADVAQPSSLGARDGNLRGTRFAQLRALLDKRARHYAANYWLLTILFALPTSFVAIAMGFSLIRPPHNNEAALPLSPALYGDGTVDFVKLDRSRWENEDTHNFGDSVLKNIIDDSSTRRMKSIIDWSEQDETECSCVDGRQKCKADNRTASADATLLIPNATQILNWIVTTEALYTEKRYGGWSTTSSGDNSAGLVVWYNNKGHHALPAYVNAVNSAVLRTVSGDARAAIHTYTHPLKISQEQLSKSTLLQHVADVGISCFILIAFSLVPAGGAVYLVAERRSQQKQLQLMCGVAPNTYWLATLVWDLFVIGVNIALTSCVLLLFSFPVFVEKDNLPAICLLLFLFGFACSSLVHLLEKCFVESSLATMMLFCGNVFVGVTGLAVLLILDILSDSDFTDHIRWVLHEVFLVSPQFALGDGLVEIAKNTIQAQVLKRFNMDTYKSPLEYELIGHHYVALALVGALLFSLNMLVENNWFDKCFRRKCEEVEETNDDTEDMDVATERYRVELDAVKSAARPVTVHTLGNINAGFVTHRDDKGGEAGGGRGEVGCEGDVLQVLALRKEYVSVTGNRVAVDNVTFGLRPGQCTGLLGANGAGKSSTFGVLSGQLLPSAGRVLLCGRPAERAHLRRGHISYCPQSDALDPLLTTRQQLKFYCQLRGITNMEEVVDRTMSEFDLSKYSSQRTRTLSGGNKRKLCAAIALMSHAPLVLLDEPTSGMDPWAARAVLSRVRDACRRGRAVLLSTHALAECGAVCERVAVMAAGRLAALGTTQHLNRRFGGGYLLCVRVSHGSHLPALLAALTAEFPLSRTLCSQYCTAQLLVPVANPGGKSEVSTALSDILSALARLNTRHNIQDFTLNQSSLDQMFVNFTNSLGCQKKQSFPETDTETLPEEFSRAVLERFSSTKLDEEDVTVVTSL